MILHKILDLTVKFYKYSMFNDPFIYDIVLEYHAKILS